MLSLLKHSGKYTNLISRQIKPICNIRFYSKTSTSYEQKKSNDFIASMYNRANLLKNKCVETISSGEKILRNKCIEAIDNNKETPDYSLNKKQKNGPIGAILQMYTFICEMMIYSFVGCILFYLIFLLSLHLIIINL